MKNKWPHESKNNTSWGPNYSHLRKTHFISILKTWENLDCNNVWFFSDNCWHRLLLWMQWQKCFDLASSTNKSSYLINSNKSWVMTLLTNNKVRFTESEEKAFFYRTRVRSLVMLVTNSLSDWLTDSLLFSKLDACEYCCVEPSPIIVPWLM